MMGLHWLMMIIRIQQWQQSALQSWVRLAGIAMRPIYAIPHAQMQRFTADASTNFVPRSPPLKAMLEVAIVNLETLLIQKSDHDLPCFATRQTDRIKIHWRKIFYCCLN
jgi:hypothetical protein